jgi:hypothetical protein
MKKSQNMRVLDQQNGFWLSSCAQFAEVGKCRGQGYNTCLLLFG